MLLKQRIKEGLQRRTSRPAVVIIQNRRLLQISAGGKKSGRSDSIAAPLRNVQSQSMQAI